MIVKVVSNNYKTIRIESLLDGLMDRYQHFRGTHPDPVYMITSKKSYNLSIHYDENLRSHIEMLFVM